MICTNLSSGWEFKLAGQAGPPWDEWRPVRSMPSSIHQDLIHHNLISNPNLSLNEIDCQWVGEKTWTYRVRLPDIGKTSSSSRKHSLVFEGLDTLATVRLNGQVILLSDNMFVRHRVDITRILKQHLASRPEKKHENQDECMLEIDFDPIEPHAKRIQAAHPNHKWIGSNGDMTRLAVRKAQYHWGWDWGPKVLTCGPWRSVTLETYEKRITQLHVHYEVHLESNSVSGYFTAKFEGCRGSELLRFTVKLMTSAEDDPSGPRNPPGALFTIQEKVSKDPVVRSKFHIDNVQFWYPHGYGAQPLYEITASLHELQDDDGSLLDKRTQTTAFRICQLVQGPDAHGESFYLRINNTPIFCGGSDWIPAHIFAPKLSRSSEYRELLMRAVEGNQVMLRIWGGGVYEPDEFYDLCDELGILVWQDFMFACGNYPAFPKMLESIELEASQQVQRLQRHPCVVIYAGNNEDYQIAEQFGLAYDSNDKNPANWLKTDFPARYIYEKILPGIVGKYSQHVPYLPGSPWSGSGRSTSSQDFGDLHQWNVWHGTQEKYQRFPALGGRFVSEFGLEAFPHVSTLESFVPSSGLFNATEKPTSSTNAASHFLEHDPAYWYAQSQVMDYHNKAAGGERRIATYITENFRLRSTSLEEYVYLSQMAQAEAMLYAYRGWRRQWAIEDQPTKRESDLKSTRDAYKQIKQRISSSPAQNRQTRRCGGVLVWQLNDCWPGISWSIIDSALVPKPAFYTIKRALAPLAIAVQRDHVDWSDAHSLPSSPIRKWRCWVASSQLIRVMDLSVEVRFIGIHSGRDIRDKVTLKGVTIKANDTTDLCHGQIGLTATEEPCVISAILIRNPTSSSKTDDRLVLSRDHDWPQPFKYYDMSGDRGLKITLGSSRIARVPPKPSDITSSASSSFAATSSSAAISTSPAVSTWRIHLSTTKPIKSLVFDEWPGLRFSDNNITLMPRASDSDSNTEERIVDITLTQEVQPDSQAHLPTPGRNRVTYRYLDGVAGHIATLHLLYGHDASVFNEHDDWVHVDARDVRE